jgi:hypothetical protein
VNAALGKALAGCIQYVVPAARGGCGGDFWHLRNHSAHS